MKKYISVSIEILQLPGAADIFTMSVVSDGKIRDEDIYEYDDSVFM